MSNFAVLDRIVAQFAALMERQHNLDIRENFELFYFIHLLIRDANMGLDWDAKLTPCKVDYFLQRAMEKYLDPTDPIANCVKLKYYFCNCKEVKLAFLKEKYVTIFNDGLQSRMDHLMQYPETSDAQQIETILKKLRVFIIASCNLGSLTDHVLLNQVRLSIKRIVDHKDIKKFLLNRRYQRWDYVKRLCAIVGGIVIHSNSAPGGDKEHMRDVIAEVFSAQDITKKCIEKSIDRVTQLISDALEMSERSLILNGKERKLICVLPIEKTRTVTAYLSLFTIYKHYLEELCETFRDIEHLIGVEEEKFRCAIIKINEVLADRTEILSEYIFPHFKHLAEVWNTMELYIHFLTDVNKIKERMDAFVNESLIKHFETAVATLTAKLETQLKVEHTFRELSQRSKTQNGVLNYKILKDHMNQYCTFTIILTNGLLIPSHFQHKLCQTSEVMYGFHDVDLFKYVALCSETFYPELRNSILGSVALVLLFNLENNVLKEYYEATIPVFPKTCSVECQYEWQRVNDLANANKVNVTSNKWDFHRETIRLANIRKCQTRSVQTTVTYGQRNAQNQAGLRSVHADSGNYPATRDAAT